jgi:hypothetical protein
VIAVLVGDEEGDEWSSAEAGRILEEKDIVKIDARGDDFLTGLP